MQISEIRVKLVSNRTDRLKAFCSVTFDNSFVVRDLKIIEGAGGYFVAMPSRKITDHCNSCGGKNHLRARFCSECGSRLDENRANRKAAGRTKLHADVAHPINSASREQIQSAIVEAYHNEVELSKQPGYKPKDLGDELEEDYSMHHEPTHQPAQPPPEPRPVEHAPEPLPAQQSLEPQDTQPDEPSETPPPDPKQSDFSKGIM